MRVPKHLVFACGIQYSGKSTFCRELEKEDPRGYTHLQMDEGYKVVRKHPKLFTNMFRMYVPRIYEEMLDMTTHDFPITDEDKARCYQMRMKEAGKEKDFSHQLLIATILYTGFVLIHLHEPPEADFDEDVVPMLDCHVPSRRDREILYRALACTMPLDEVRKRMVYFDQGLGQSLKRYHKNLWTPDQNRSGLPHDRKNIREAHAKQELPTPDEFPNFEVHIVRKKKKVYRAKQWVCELRETW